MKKENQQYFQQGDVLLYIMGDTNLPTDLTLTDTKVVQEGEHTGHAHRLSSGEVYINPTTKEKYLRLLEETTISHEEHKPIRLPRGNYRIGIVQEYDHFNEEARAVLD